MRLMILLILLFCCFSVRSQLFEDFSDGDFNSNPLWLGDTSEFQVNNFQLQSQGSLSSDVIYISTPYTSEDSIEISFDVRLDFNPSSSNFVRIYLQSDTGKLEIPLFGYFIQFGEASTTADSLDFYEQESSLVTKLFSSPFPCMTSSSSNLVNVRVLKKRANWEIYAHCPGNNSEQLAGKFISDTLVKSISNFGFYCDYSTSSRSDKYFFDNIQIRRIIKDTVPPWITGFELHTRDSIVLIFSEEVDSSVLMPNKVLINGALSSEIYFISKEEIGIKLMNPLKNGSQNILELTSVTDPANNRLDTVIYFDYYEPQAFDIIITEVMSDPTPAFGLPAVEFIELFNCSQWQISLANWILSDPGRSVILPDHVVQANEFVTLVHFDSLELFKKYGSAIGLSDWPSLNNDEDHLILRSEDGQIMHQLKYSSSWHEDGKRNGGFSLEMIDNQNPCGENSNWSSSYGENGGTPSEENAISMENPDIVNPALIRAKYYDSLTIGLVFSEQIDSSNSILDPANFIIKDNLVTEVRFANNFRKELIIELQKELSSNQHYNITVNGIHDCVGLQALISNNVVFGIPEQAQKEDFIINEILFNPESGGVDFLELFNRSDKIFDLNGYFIFEINPETAALLEITELKIGSYLFLPGDHVVLTEDKLKVIDFHKPGFPYKVVEVNDFPNFSDEASVVYITKPSSIPIDRVSYSKDWHTELLGDLNGVSLERINSNDSASNPMNWQSASASEDFATPTEVNSHHIDSVSTHFEVNFENRLFSPNGDGANDLLLFTIKKAGSGDYVSITIFTDKGQFIKQLAFNSWLGNRSQFKWDGVDEDGQKAGIGIYFLLIEWFDEGEKKINRQYEEIVLGGYLK
ncbi:MAG: hypothetical protein HKN92_03575 [Chitinophagales bacterium]|nr:hypothetical protein [Chitinophagales bacterium]